MELKYTTKDTEKILDTFVRIQEKGIKNINLIELEPLLDYPKEVLAAFLKCMDYLDKMNYDNDYIRENYDALMGYITIRLNIAEQKQ